MSTSARFEKEAKRNSEMAYSPTVGRQISIKPGI